MTAVPPCFSEGLESWDKSQPMQCGAIFDQNYVLKQGIGGSQIFDDIQQRPKVRGTEADLFVHSHPGILTNSLRAVSDSMQARLAGPTQHILHNYKTNGAVTDHTSLNPLLHGDGGVHLAPSTANPFVCGGGKVGSNYTSRGFAITCIRFV